MTTLVFDTHRAIKRLVASGMTEQQAEAVVEVAAEAMTDLVTKQELARQLKQDSTELEIRLLTKFSAIVGAVAAVSVWFLTHAN